MYMHRPSHTYIHVYYRLAHIPIYLQVRVMKDEPCRVLCAVELTKEDSKQFIERIQQDYTIHMLVNKRSLMQTLKEYVLYWCKGMMSLSSLLYVILCVYL